MTFDEDDKVVKRSTMPEKWYVVTVDHSESLTGNLKIPVANGAFVVVTLQWKQRIYYINCLYIVKYLLMFLSTFVAFSFIHCFHFPLCYGCNLRPSLLSVFGERAQLSKLW